MKIKDYFTPKSMVYTGQHDDVKTVIRHYQYDEETFELSDDFSGSAGVKHYIQVVGLSDVKTIETLKKHYPVEDIILEDIFNVHQRNKIEVRDGYLFAVFHSEYLEGNTIQEDYMSILLFNDTLISFHEREPKVLGPLVPLFESFHELRKRSVDFLFFQVLDILTDQHLDVYEYLEAYSTRFEEEILETKSINQEDFYLIRKHLLKLKNNISPTLEHLEKSLIKSQKIIRQDNLDYFDDLKDHLMRLDNHLNQARELMRHLLDLHINNQSNKMNRIMTTLTLFSAIFIPLSFLTGFFGMNFVHFEVLEYEHSLAIFIGLCFALAGLMFLLFKKMRWFE